MKSSGMMGTSPIVLTTLVVALLAAATARPSTNPIIRLPTSSGGADAGRAWECCDFAVRDPVFRPPRWQCNDVVKECSTNCRECEKLPAGDGYVCHDWIVSLLEPPVCTPRPWNCCDAAVCVSWDDIIPTCWCADEVKACPSNCKECELVESSCPRRYYRCLDRFHGYPGPKCTPGISKGN
ncbi:unnamed protein product [Urochloa humidicola]